MQIVLLLRSAETTANTCCCFQFAQNHPYFRPLFSRSEPPVSVQHLRNIRKCSYPVETLSVEGVCVMVFFQPGAAGHTDWRIQSKKQTKQQQRKRQRERTGDKGNMNGRLLALSCLHAGFSVQCLSAGLY